MHKYITNTTFALAKYKLNDKTDVTSPNIRKHRIIPILLYVTQLIYHGRYKKRVMPSIWLSDVGGNDIILRISVTFLYCKCHAEV